MKKIFVVASALLMCCMFMGCGVKAQLVGTWESSVTEENSCYADFNVISGEDELDMELPAVNKSQENITFTINKDGTFSWEDVVIDTYTVDMDAVEEEYDEIPAGTTFTSLNDSKITVKMSGTWYYHDSDKIILKITKYSEQYDDEDPEISDDIEYLTAEVVLVDDILFVDYGYSTIIEFTKAK